MKKRLFSFLFSFVLFSVAFAAVNCGCVFAGVEGHAEKAIQSPAGHCDHGGKTASETAKQECCGGCERWFGTINAPFPEIQAPMFKGVDSGGHFSDASFLPLHTIYTAVRFSRSGPVVPGPGPENSRQPLYISFSSLLI